MTNKTNHSDTNRPTTATTEDGAKKVFRVVASCYQTFYIFVEAPSEDEAFDIGTRVDGEYWNVDHEGDWEVEYAEPEMDAPLDELLAQEAYNSL